MELAARLAEQGEAWPELLAPLLRRLASDPVASVRAGILRHLPYLHHKHPDLGWDLLDRCLTAPHPALWELAGETLYYQLRHQFGRVAPYLDRMLAETSGQADETWSRLTTLALLEGQLSEDVLFARLTTLERPSLWQGAASVFSANIGKAELAPACRSGLSRILDCAKAIEIVVVLDRVLMSQIGFQSADLRIVERFIDCIGPSHQRRNLFELPKWLATAARRDPTQVLPLLEKLAPKVEGWGLYGGFLHGEPLIDAMLEILREADQSDDPMLIARAIALQDRFLGIGLTGMEDMLEKATRC
jgi:hypothetical protein